MSIICDFMLLVERIACKNNQKYWVYDEQKNKQKCTRSEYAASTATIKVAVIISLNRYQTNNCSLRLTLDSSSSNNLRINYDQYFFHHAASNIFLLFFFTSPTSYL